MSDSSTACSSFVPFISLMVFGVKTVYPLYRSIELLLLSRISSEDRETNTRDRSSSRKDSASVPVSVAKNGKDSSTTTEDGGDPSSSSSSTGVVTKNISNDTDGDATTNDRVGSQSTSQNKKDDIADTDVDVLATPSSTLASLHLNNKTALSIAVAQEQWVSFWVLCSIWNFATTYVLWWLVPYVPLFLELEALFFLWLVHPDSSGARILCQKGQVIYAENAEMIEAAAGSVVLVRDRGTSVVSRKSKKH
ncbi:unnamed protein product [Amoebophrya sp. A25]|nr:unnamed protein product [Amoebophrya sp. A25]|eukprot:GSA25T00008982001.1